mgnify:CR=1 FL=1
MIPCNQSRLLRNRQRPGLPQSRLHGAGEELLPATEVHHAALSGTERPGRALDPHLQGAMRTPPSLRNPAAREPDYWRLDRVLQQPAPTSGGRNEDAR